MEEEQAMEDKLRSFATSLLVDNPKARLSHVKRLQSFVATCSPSFRHEDYFKLWEALFFALWSADGQAVQRRIGVDFCKLLYSVPEDRIPVWFDAMWFVLQRDWNHLDRYRIDKFQLFVRMVIAETCHWLRSRHWEAQAIAHVTTSWQYGPLRPHVAGDTGATGVSYHLVDILMEEIRNAVAEDEAFSPSILVSLLEPFLVALCTRDDPGLAQKIHDKIILSLNPEVDGEVEAVAEQLFTWAAARRANLKIKRLYASIHALDAALASVGKRVDYSKILNTFQNDTPTGNSSADATLTVKEMHQLSKDLRKGGTKKKPRTKLSSSRKHQKSSVVVFSTRRRKVAGKRRV